MSEKIVIPAIRPKGDFDQLVAEYQSATENDASGKLHAIVHLASPDTHAFDLRQRAMRFLMQIGDEKEGTNSRR